MCDIDTAVTNSSSEPQLDHFIYRLCKSKKGWKMGIAINFLFRVRGGGKKDAIIELT